MGGNKDRDLAATLIENANKSLPEEQTVDMGGDGESNKENIPRGGGGDDDLLVSLGMKNSSSGSRPRGSKPTNAATEQLVAQGAEMTATMRSLIEIMAKNEDKHTQKDILIKNQDMWLGMSLSLDCSLAEVKKQCLNYLGSTESPEVIEAILITAPGSSFPVMVTEPRQLAVDGRSSVTVNLETRDDKKYLMFK